MACNFIIVVEIVSVDYRIDRQKELRDLFMASKVLRI